MKSKLILIALLIVLLLTALLLDKVAIKFAEMEWFEPQHVSEPVTNPPVSFADATHYQCDNNQHMTIQDIPNEDGVVVDLSDGRLIVLSTTSTEVGKRYANDGESFVLTIEAENVGVYQTNPTSTAYVNCIRR